MNKSKNRMPRKILLMHLCTIHFIDRFFFFSFLSFFVNLCIAFYILIARNEIICQTFDKISSFLSFLFCLYFSLYLFFVLYPFFTCSKHYVEFEFVLLICLNCIIIINTLICVFILYTFS